jgi:hypothetical protein
VQRGVVAFGLRQGEKLLRIGEARVDLLDVGDDLLEAAAFLAEVLGALGVGPDARVFEGRGDFYEARLPGVVVKDTSGARRRGPGGRRGCSR